MSGAVSIIGGGWSVRGVDLAKVPGYVIAVNGAALHAPRVDAVVTMDRLFAEHTWLRLVEMARPTWIRTAALKNIKERPDWLHPFENDNAGAEMSEFTNRLNGNNSGFCALNLAYLLRPAMVRLYGFDMNRSSTGEAYWHPPHEWSKDPRGGTGAKRYAEWVVPFAMAAKAFEAKGIEIVNMSLTSAIPFFRKEKP